jgi:hypothetical protein
MWRLFFSACDASTSSPHNPRSFRFSLGSRLRGNDAVRVSGE